MQPEPNLSHYKQLMLQAIEMINKDLKSIGKFDNPSLLERYLVTSAIKATNLSYAILILCKKHLINESFPILRSLIEHSINMRWITHQDTENRFNQYADTMLNFNMGVTWSDKNMLNKMIDIGFPDDYYKLVVKNTYDYSHINARSLPWLIIDGEKNEFSPIMIYPVAAQMLGHVMVALNTHFPEYFTKHLEIWEKIEYDANAWEKYVKIKKQILQNEGH